MHWKIKKKKFIWLTLLQYKLYCSSLQLNPQYPWGMPVLKISSDLKSSK